MNSGLNGSSCEVIVASLVITSRQVAAIVLPRNRTEMTIVMCPKDNFMMEALVSTSFSSLSENSSRDLGSQVAKGTTYLPSVEVNR